MSLVPVPPGINLLTGTFDLPRHTPGSGGGGAPAAHNFLDSATHNNVVTGLPVQGYLIKGNATPAWERFAFGASEMPLHVNTGATDIEYSVLKVPGGGTGATSFTAGSVIFAGATTLAEDNANFFYNDATNGLGLGTNNPLAKLHVVLSTSGAIPAGSAPFCVQNDALVGDISRMTIIGGASGESILQFGDASDADVGRIRYMHSTNHMIFYTTGGISMRLTNTALLGLNTGLATPAGRAEFAQSAGTCDLILRQIGEGAGTKTALVGLTGAAGAAQANTNFLSRIETDITQANPATLKTELYFLVNTGDTITEVWRFNDDGTATSAFALTADTLHFANAGAVGAPSISLSTDLDSGFWHPGADILAASIGGAEIWRLAAGLVTLTATDLNLVGTGGTGFIEMGEYNTTTDAAAPAADRARIYVRDDGAGKEELCVIFATGAVQVIASEP